MVSLQEGQGMHGVSHNEDKSQEVTCIVRQCTAANDYVQKRALEVERPWALFLAMCRARVELKGDRGEGLARWLSSSLVLSSAPVQVQLFKE